MIDNEHILKLKKSVEERCSDRISEAKQHHKTITKKDECGFTSKLKQNRGL